MIGITAAQFLCGGVLLLPYLFLSGDLGASDWGSGELWWSIAFIVVGAQVLAYLTFYVALTRWPGSRVYPWAFLAPVVAIVIEALPRQPPRRGGRPPAWRSSSPASSSSTCPRPRRRRAALPRGRRGRARPRRRRTRPPRRGGRPRHRVAARPTSTSRVCSPRRGAGRSSVSRPSTRSGERIWRTVPEHRVLGLGDQVARDRLRIAAPRPAMSLTGPHGTPAARRRSSHAAEPSVEQHGARARPRRPRGSRGAPPSSRSADRRSSTRARARRTGGRRTCPSRSATTIQPSAVREVLERHDRRVRGVRDALRLVAAREVPGRDVHVEVHRRLEERDVAVAADAVAPRAPEAAHQRERRRVPGRHVDEREARSSRAGRRARRSATSSPRSPAGCSRSRPPPRAARSCRSPTASSTRSPG